MDEIRKNLPERFSPDYQAGLERVKARIVNKMWRGGDIGDVLREYAYVAEMDEVVTGDYVRYVSFDGGELKRGGLVVGLDYDLSNLKLRSGYRLWTIRYDTHIIFRRRSVDEVIALGL